MKSGQVTRKALPIGSLNDGSFTYRKSLNIANGTLDYMVMVVDTSLFDLSNPDNYQITGDTFTYNYNGLDFMC